MLSALIFKHAYIFNLVLLCIYGLLDLYFTLLKDLNLKPN